MHSLSYNSDLFYAKDSFAVYYSEYGRTVLGRKHYGNTRKYRK